MTKRNPEKAVQMLDLLLEFFGEDGHRWTAGEWHDNRGNRCLVGAMAHLRAVMKLQGDTAAGYLRAAIPPEDMPLRHVWPVSNGQIEDFNDECSSYDEIRAVILKARDLAQADLDGQSDKQKEPGRARKAADNRGLRDISASSGNFTSAAHRHTDSAASPAGGSLH